jgi:hypothetical protein
MQHKLRTGALASAVAVGVVIGVLGFSGAGAGAGRAATLFVPERSLDGVRLGMTPAEVTALWGRRHGVCRNCERTTWYFNARPFEPQGTAVGFEDGRVVHAYTVWQPSGWRTREGLSLGDQEGRVHDLYGPLSEETCDRYLALVLSDDRVDSVFYVYRDSVWGLGLKRPRVSACV